MKFFIDLYTSLWGSAGEAYLKYREIPEEIRKKQGLYYLDYVPNDQKVISESSSVGANQESELEDDLDELLDDDESQKEELQ